MNPKLKKKGEPEFVMRQEEAATRDADAHLRVVSEKNIDEDPECSISAQQRGADYQLGRLGISSPCAHLAPTLSPVINFPSRFAGSTMGSKVVHQGCCGGQTPKPPWDVSFFSFGCFPFASLPPLQAIAPAS